MAKLVFGTNSLLMAVTSGLGLVLVGVFLGTFAGIYNSSPLSSQAILFLFGVGGATIGLFTGAREDAKEERKEEKEKRFEDAIDTTIHREVEIMRAKKLYNLEKTILDQETQNPVKAVEEQKKQ